MRLIVSFVFALFCTNSFAQSSDGPVEVTPAIEKKIRQGVEQSAARLKADLKKDGVPDLVLEFTVDTFRIEQYAGQYMEYDYSTAGMRGATHEAARRYDSLLNKYYKKLAAVLKPEDRKVLVLAQKAWLAYRDSELKLVGVISKDEYSGGGTIQQLIDSSYYLELIKTRTLELYDHLVRATGAY
jgi:uncharacterized protein YecT (DUF1311 family)